MAAGPFGVRLLVNGRATETFGVEKDNDDRAVGSHLRRKYWCIGFFSLVVNEKA